PRRPDRPGGGHLRGGRPGGGPPGGERQAAGRAAGVPRDHDRQEAAMTGVVTVLDGDCRDLLPGLHADVIITDPPYGVTSHKWDRWPDGWVELAFAAAPH